MTEPLRPARWPRRILPFAASLVLAGCLTAPASEDPNTPASPLSPLADSRGYHAEGRVFIAEPNEGFCWETSFPFPVNATAARIVLHLEVGGSYGVELPRPLATAYAEIRDPGNATLARGERGAADPAAFQVEGEGAVPGTHAVLLGSCVGGSDGEAYGDYISYALDVSGKGG